MNKLLKKITLVPVARITKVRATNQSSNSATKMKQVFDTDIYKASTAIKVKHKIGYCFNALITDSGYDFIQCIRVNATGETTHVEIELEDYINGIWFIQKI